MKRRGYNFTYQSPDITFLTIFISLVIVGFVVLASASLDLAKIKYNDSFFYLKHQIFYGLLPGIVGFLISYFFGFDFWKKISVFLVILSIISLILVFTPLGFRAYGSQRWLEIGDFSFQPSEIAKFSIILYMASWLSKNYKKKKTFKEGSLPFILTLLFIITPIIFQPATTNPIIITASCLIMYFLSGTNLKSLAFIFLVFVLIFIVSIFFTDYRFSRILNYLNPDQDTTGKNYHRDISVTAIGSGGLTGVGYGKSTTKFLYLPEPIGDSIFAIIGEEFGFIGSFTLIFLYLALIWRGFKIANKTSDVSKKLFVIGAVSIIGIQAFIHMAAVSGLGVYTGIPLPFISYGGTSLAIFITMAGIIFDISRG